MAAPQPIHTRKSPIRHRRFSATDLRRVVDTLADEFEASRSHPAGAQLSISLTYADDTSYELNDSRLPVTDDPFAKPASELAIRCTLPNDGRIYLNLKHGDSQGPRNQLVVSGPDLTWVNGVTDRIMDIVAASQKQIQRGRPVLLGALGLGILYSMSVTWLSYRFLHSPGPISLLTMFIVLTLMFIGILGAAFDTLAQKMWPVVELQTGPSHAHGPTRLRNRVWIGFSVILFPFVLAFLPGILLSSSQPSTREPPAATSLDNSRVEPMNPLELSATVQKPRIGQGDVQVITARLRNRGSSVLRKLQVTIDAAGFNVQDWMRTVRFLEEQQENTQEFRIPIDKEVPKGKYVISVKATTSLPSSDLVLVSTRVGFAVE